MTLWPDCLVSPTFFRRASAIDATASGSRLFLRERSEEVGRREAGALGVEPDRFLAADHPLQLAFDAPEHLLGEIGLIFAEEVARHDGRAQVPGHRPGLVGVGEPAEALVEILEIDHGMIPVVDGEVATQPGPNPTGRGQSWTAKSNRRDSRSTETDDDRRRRRLGPSSYCSPSAMSTSIP